MLKVFNLYCNITVIKNYLINFNFLKKIIGYEKVNTEINTGKDGKIVLYFRNSLLPYLRWAGIDDGADGEGRLAINNKNVLLL